MNNNLEYSFEEKLLSIFHKFQNILKQYINDRKNCPINIDEISFDTYIEEFEFDKLDKVEITFLIEDIFNIWVTDEDLLWDGNTINSVVNYILRETDKNNKEEVKEDNYKVTRFNVITKDIDTLAETIYNLRNCRPWDNNKKNEIKLIKEWLSEKYE